MQVTMVDALRAGSMDAKFWSSSLCANLANYSRQYCNMAADCNAISCPGSGSVGTAPGQVTWYPHPSAGQKPSIP